MIRQLIISALLLAAGNVWEVIHTDSVERLYSATQIDFASAPETAGQFNTGWFALSPNAGYIAARNTRDVLAIWRSTGDFWGVYPDTALGVFVDAAFGGENRLAVVYAGENQYIVLVVDLETLISTRTMVISPNWPQSIWFDADGQLRLEVDRVQSLNRQPLIVRLPVDEGDVRVFEDDLPVLPYAPAADLDALLRIGRVPPPFVITSSADDLVKRWDVERGEVTAQAQVTDGPAMFGQINKSGSHLAWRDTESKALHLLNFETGKDIIVALLNGQYAQFLFLSPSADVIIGVNLDLQPVVVAWDTLSGQRYHLGEYRLCGRVPDMARLSQAGTALVIGCDTGLELWRVGSLK